MKIIKIVGIWLGVLVLTYLSALLMIWGMNFESDNLFINALSIFSVFGVPIILGSVVLGAFLTKEILDEY